MSEKGNLMQKVIIKCWQDESFKKKLKEDPVAVLQSEGLKVPDGVSIKVVENTENEVTFVIPQFPEQLIENRADLVSYGTGCGGFVLVGCEMVYKPSSPKSQPLRSGNEISPRPKP